MLDMSRDAYNLSLKIEDVQRKVAVTVSGKKKQLTWELRDLNSFSNSDKINKKHDKT